MTQLPRSSTGDFTPPLYAPKRLRTKAALPPPPPSKPRYTINEVAAILGRSRRYVEGLTASKDGAPPALRPVREGGWNIWIYDDELRRYENRLRAEAGLPPVRKRSA